MLSASDAADVPDEETPAEALKLFADLEPEVPVKDQGLLEIKCGTVISKKFKYFTEKAGQLRIFSSIPVLVQVRTPLVTADLEDNQKNKYAFVKF